MVLKKNLKKFLDGESQERRSMFKSRRIKDNVENN